MHIPSAALQDPFIELETGGFPAQIELIPGQVRATITLQTIRLADGQVVCWAYATHGLAAMGQRELVLLLRIALDQDVLNVPTEPLKFFREVAGLAAQGRLVDAGGQTELKGGRILGGTGFLYVDAPPLDAQLPTALLLLRVHPEEFQVLRAYGAGRLLASWGATARHYPFPPWIDESRPAVVTPEHFRTTILDSVPRIPLRAWVRYQGANVLLEISEEQRERLAALTQLPENAGFALLTHIPQEADGCFVWRAGQREPAAITPPGSAARQLGGVFVLFVPEQDAEEIRQHEDGFAIFLTQASTLALRRALVSGYPFEFRTRDGTTFSIAWLPTSYQNPVTGAVMQAPGGMRTYSPEKPAPQTGAVKVKQTVLLTGDADLRARVAIDELSSYIKRLIAIAQEALGPSAGRGGFEVLLDLKLDPGKPAALQMMTRGDGVDNAACSELYRRTEAAGPPVVRGGQVAFQLFLSVD